MNRLFCVFAVLAFPAMAAADNVLDWNSTYRMVVQANGANAINKANPGAATRNMAMMNGAIYDVFQSFSRTHSPFLVNTTAPAGASLEAAVHQAAYEVLMNNYAGESAILNSDYASRMASIAPSAAKTAGMNFGSQVAQAYIANRTGDGSANMIPYTPGTAVGEWWPQAGQNAWGPGWGDVSPFAIGSTTPFVNALPPIPAISSQTYTDGFNQVKTYGSMTSALRTSDQTDIGLFWGYDRATMGPPPVLFNRNVEDIASQAGNTTEENARLFGMASVAMADAAIAAWDAKFNDNFWRPVAAIKGQMADLTTGRDDGNSNTIEDPNWQPFGAPGADPNSMADNFTPPFPAWVSGHATMGAATFKAIELFYGTNKFDEIDGIIGNDLMYSLTSQEFDGNGQAGMSRDYSIFTQLNPLAPGMEDSPEGENGMSRIYLGIHWIWDQADGMTLGRSIASYVAANEFVAVPEPSAVLIALAACGLVMRRQR